MLNLSCTDFAGIQEFSIMNLRGIDEDSEQRGWNLMGMGNSVAAKTCINVVSSLSTDEYTAIF